MILIEKGYRNDGHSRSRPQQNLEMFFTWSMQVAPELPLVVRPVVFLHNMVLHCALKTLHSLVYLPVGSLFMRLSGQGKCAVKDLLMNCIRHWPKQ